MEQVEKHSEIPNIREIFLIVRLDRLDQLKADNETYDHQKRKCIQLRHNPHSETMFNFFPKFCFN